MKVILKQILSLRKKHKQQSTNDISDTTCKLKQREQSKTICHTYGSFGNSKKVK